MSNTQSTSRPAGSMRCFAELCGKINLHIEAASDIPFLERLGEMIVPAPAAGPMDHSAAMAWIAKAAPSALPRSVARSMNGPAKPYGDFDLFAMLSEWNIPLNPEPAAEAAQAKRWKRWHAESAVLSAGLSA